MTGTGVIGRLFNNPRGQGAPVTTIDLNSDLGEGFGAWAMGDDAAMLDVVSSANVACGFHAGEPTIMLATARAAAERGVAVGHTLPTAT